MTSTDLAPATAARLRSLRLRMTALIALLATGAVAIFAVVVIRLDRQLRNEQVDAELLRIGDNAARLVTFEDGIVEPDTVRIPDAVVAVNPSFSIQEFEAQQERFDFPDPSPEEIEEYLRLAFDDAEFDSRAFLVAVVLEENGLDPWIDEIDFAELFDEGATTVGPIEIEREDGGVETVEATELFLDELTDLVVNNPPEDLSDEAYRRYVEVQADAADVELAFETTFFATADSPLADDVLFTISDTVTENASEPYRDAVVGADGTLWDVRATALRDGPEVRGALISVVDPTEFDAAHEDLRNRVVVLAAAIVAGSVVAAWFLAARTIAPAGRALAQQERFLADAAHELRTPIAAIRLTAESARPETAETNLARVAELAADASTLTDDLLTLARMDADRMELQRENVRLDLLIESTVSALPQAEDAIVLTGDTPVVAADPRLLERAIGNLIRNAVAHGGASRDTPAVVTIASTGSTYQISVRDHGPGIDAAVAEGLFERFRSRTGSRGHGLGLPLARWIAQAHGGDLTLASKTDDGSEFVLSLPG
ncbi:MAG: HAMP domain-containing sensor histidine kinase [Actinomycetota bacterium]